MMVLASLHDGIIKDTPYSHNLLPVHDPLSLARQKYMHGCKFLINLRMVDLGGQALVNEMSALTMRSDDTFQQVRLINSIST